MARDILSSLLAVGEEAQRAMAKHSSYNSLHEAYAVLQEEVDELFDAIRANDPKAARAEAVQVGAVAVRFLTDFDYMTRIRPPASEAVPSAESSDQVPVQRVTTEQVQLMLRNFRNAAGECRLCSCAPDAHHTQDCPVRSFGTLLLGKEV